jgi:hypothetical protein
MMSVLLMIDLEAMRTEILSVCNTQLWRSDLDHSC